MKMRVYPKKSWYFKLQDLTAPICCSIISLILGHDKFPKKRRFRWISTSHKLSPFDYLWFTRHQYTKRLSVNSRWFVKFVAWSHYHTSEYYSLSNAGKIIIYLEHHRTTLGLYVKTYCSNNHPIPPLSSQQSNLFKLKDNKKF